MALSTLQIKNMALEALPTRRIETEGEVSVAAEATAAAYQPALELLLEDYDWGFAIRRQTLAVVVNDRENEWGYAYRAPSDLVRPRVLLPFGAGDSAAGAYPAWGPFRAFESMVPYRLAGTTVYANREAAILEYVSNDLSPATFTPMFTRALSLEIASRVVMPILKDRQRQGDLVKQAEVARERAKAAEMNRDHEGVRDFISESQLVRAGVLPWQ